MSSLEILTVSEDEDADSDLEILSEAIVPGTSRMAAMELTPVEQRRLLEQLKLPKDAQVEIKVVGSGGGDKRRLVSGGMTAHCRVLMNGLVVRQKSLQGNKIFRPRKSPPQAPALAIDSEILTISDEESEPDLSPVRKVTLQKRGLQRVAKKKKRLQNKKIIRPRNRSLQAASLREESEVFTISDDESETDLSPVRKVTLQKRGLQKPSLVTDHLLLQHRHRSTQNGGLDLDVEETSGAKDHQAPCATKTNTVYREEQDSRWTVLSLSQSDSQGSVSVHPDIPETFPIQLDIQDTFLLHSDTQETLSVKSQDTSHVQFQFDRQETHLVQPGSQEMFAVQSNFQEVIRIQLGEGQNLPAQEISQIEFNNIKTVHVQSNVEEEVPCTSEVQVANPRDDTAVITAQSDGQAVIAVTSEKQAAITAKSDDESVNILQGDTTSVEDDEKATQKYTTRYQSVDLDATVTENDNEVSSTAQCDEQASVTVQSKEQVAITFLSGDKPVSNLQSCYQAAMSAESGNQDFTTAQKAKITVQSVNQAATTAPSHEQGAISVQSKKEVAITVLSDDHPVNTLQGDNLAATSAESDYQAATTAPKVTTSVPSVNQAVAKVQNDDHETNLCQVPYISPSNNEMLAPSPSSQEILSGQLECSSIFPENTSVHILPALSSVQVTSQSPVQSGFPKSHQPDTNDNLDVVPNFDKDIETNPEEEELDRNNPSSANNSHQATVSIPEDSPSATSGCCSPTDLRDSNFPPFISISSLEITAVKPGKLFLPIYQLSQLLPAVKVKDLVSECPDLAEDTIWDGRGVSHISVVAAIRVLDRYGDVFGLREELEVKQEIVRLEKNTGMTENQGNMVSPEKRESKEDFMAMLGLCRKEEVEELKNEINIRRERARTRTRLRSGTRRKQSPNVALVGGKRSKDRSAARRVEGVNKKGKGKRKN